MNHLTTLILCLVSYSIAFELESITLTLSLDPAVAYFLCTSTFKVFIANCKLPFSYVKLEGVYPGGSETLYIYSSDIMERGNCIVHVKGQLFRAISPLPHLDNVTVGKSLNYVSIFVK